MHVLERLWTRLWIAVLIRTANGRRAVSPPDWSSKRWRILFLRHDKLGDMVTATGLLRAIKKQHPNVQLDVMASPYNEVVLRGNPWVDGIRRFRSGKGLTYPRALLALRRARYDVIIDPVVHRAQRANLMLCVASGAPYRIGFLKRWEGAFTLPVADPGTHETYVRRAAAVLLPFGIDPEASDLRSEIFLTQAEQATAERTWPTGPEPRLLVNLSARSASRRWPDDRFVAAILELVRRTGAWNVVVISAPADRDSTDVIASSLREAGVAAVAARTPAIHDAFALVASTQLVLTPDTSITHAASAFNVPTVALMEKAELTWRPYATPGRTVVTAEKSYATISVEEVATALSETAAETGILRNARKSVT